MGCAEMYRSGNFTATGARAGLILFFSVIARSASAQSRDTTGADTTRVKQLKTITVTAERPRAAAPPVTTLVVPAAELRRTFANNPYDCSAGPAELKYTSRARDRASPPMQ